MGINPFDIKTVLLAKHAQHVVLIHFPIALFTVAAAFDYFGQWTRPIRVWKRSETNCPTGKGKQSSGGEPCNLEPSSTAANAMS